MLNPKNDGIDHINAYSKGVTRLGRLLSNFAHTPFEHPRHGHFESVEGYWYWLTRQDDHLRTLYGYQAKQYGKQKPQVMTYTNEDFQQYIREAIVAKLNAHSEIKSLLATCELPLFHYYVYNFGGVDKVIEPKGSDWLMAIFEQIRLESNPQADSTNLIKIRSNNEKKPEIKDSAQLELI